MSSTSKQSTGTVPKTNKAEKKIEKPQERNSNAGQHINVSYSEKHITEHTVGI